MANSARAIEGRSRSKLNNRQVQIARERAKAMTPSSPAPSRSPAPPQRGSVLSPILPIPGFGGGDQMKRNTDAINQALGGRIAPRRKSGTRPGNSFSRKRASKARA